MYKLKSKNFFLLSLINFLILAVPTTLLLFYLIEKSSNLSLFVYFYLFFLLVPFLSGLDKRKKSILIKEIDFQNKIITLEKNFQTTFENVYIEENFRRFKLFNLGYLFYKIFFTPIINITYFEKNGFYLVLYTSKNYTKLFLKYFKQDFETKFSNLDETPPKYAFSKKSKKEREEMFKRLKLSNDFNKIS